LAQSINVPAVEALYLVGLPDAMRLAKALGITTLKDPNQYGLTLVLGGGEVSLLDMVSAYSTFANEGVRNPHRSVLRIEDRNGSIVKEYAAAPQQVLDSNVALMISDVLSDNVARTPEFGSDSALYFPGRHVAAKTGTTTETAGGARIHEKATALVPLIASADFAGAVAHTVSAEADGSGIRMVGIKDFGGLLISASSTPGVDPIQFQLTGQALLIWDVNAADLAQALAGRDQSAFQTIVTGFPGIQSATARIEPFWSSTFPGDASNIRVKINDPAPGSSQQ
jgi:hypothetical protein